MQFIPESIINQQAETIGQTNDHAILIKQLKAAQPAVFAYLFSESFELLTTKEKEYTIFLALVIYHSIVSFYPEQSIISEKVIEKAEETNWELLNESKARSFRDKLDAFFDQTKQEDLLAFIEDAVVFDEDELVTKEGAEYIFVGMKSILDSFEKVCTD